MQRVLINLEKLTLPNVYTLIENKGSQETFRKFLTIRSQRFLFYNIASNHTSKKYLEWGNKMNSDYFGFAAFFRELQHACFFCIDSSWYPTSHQGVRLRRGKFFFSKNPNFLIAVETLKYLLLLPAQVHHAWCISSFQKKE